MLGLVNCQARIVWLDFGVLSVWFVIMGLLTFVSESHWFIVCLSTLMLLLHGFIGGFGNTTIGCIFPMTKPLVHPTLIPTHTPTFIRYNFLFDMRHRTVIPCLHFTSEFAKRNGFYFRTSDVHILAHTNTTRSVYHSFANDSDIYAFALHIIACMHLFWFLFVNGSSHWKWKSNAYLMLKPYRYGTQNWDKICAHLGIKTHCRLSRWDSRNWPNEWMVWMVQYFANIILCQQVDTGQYYLLFVMVFYRKTLSG